MKVSHFIFLVGIILLIIEVMIIQSDLGSNSDSLVEGLVSEDVFDKIITLYFFITVMLFFFGGIIFFFEKGMNRDPLEQYPEPEKHSMLKKRSTRSNPLM